MGLRSDEALALREKSNIWLNCSWAGHTYVSINYNRPPFDDIRVRQALSYATPYREVIERGFLGLARPWRSPLSVFDAWYSDEHWTFHTNVSRARELLIEAGYSDGLTLNLYVPLRSDLIRVGELLRAAYALIGVMVELRDMSMVQPGWHPTFYLRAECGHNVNEPVYDIAHDHVLVKPLVNEGAVPEYVDTWFGAYPGSREFEGMYRAILLAPSDAERHWHCEQMQAAVVAAAPIIFLAENLQISAGNSAAPPQLRDFRNRVVQALHYQNANTSYCRYVMRLWPSSSSLPERGLQVHLSCGKYEVNTITDGFPGRSTRHGGLGWCTVTLLRSEDHVVVVDTGTMSMRPVILQRLEALGVDPDDVTDLLLTHSHHDHSINWVAFRNARVVIGRTELAWSLEQQAGRTMVPELYMQALRDSARLHPTTDGQEVAPGIFSRATPGHTPGI